MSDLGTPLYPKKNPYEAPIAFLSVSLTHDVEINAGKLTKYSIIHFSTNKSTHCTLTQLAYTQDKARSQG